MVSREARDFVERYMGQIVSILLEQQPGKVGPQERRCVSESLSAAISIISNDLDIQIKRGRRYAPAAGGNVNEAECKTLDVLACIFDKKKTYYRGPKTTHWNTAHLSGLPELRLDLVHAFQKEISSAQRRY